MSKLSETTPKTNRRKGGQKDKAQAFVDVVWAHYKAHGRNWLPWRNLSVDKRGHVDAYRILVSEVMCQQTQVDRVAPKYDQFLAAFPTVTALSKAPLGDVLRLWQGLGYNRRAKMLHQCAAEVVRNYGGTLPQERAELEQLSGIGPYTAGAVAVFAYNIPTPLIETNIRTAYLYHFFKNAQDVADSAIHEYVQKTMDWEAPRTWFSALMDYGAHIKKSFGNQNVRSKIYTKQSPFVGSDREIRGAIVRVLSKQRCTYATLAQALSFQSDRLKTQLGKLEAECLIRKNNRTYSLPE